MIPHFRHIRAIKSALETGVLKPHVSKFLAFEEMADAHVQIEPGQTIGKVIVKL